MAKKPTKSSGSVISNIMGMFRGNFDFKQPKTPDTKTLAIGSSELISSSEKNRLLHNAQRTIEQTDRIPVSSGSLLSLVQGSLGRVGQDRLENRKILQLMPEVDKAARLMVASIFSPNDLSRQNISVVFDCDEISEDYQRKLTKEATDFFQAKLNLKTSAPSWVYQFGYETGAAVFAIIPLRSFENIQEDSYAGMEAFVEKVVNPLCQESLFGFGDTGVTNALANDIAGLESFSDDVILATKAMVEGDHKPFANGKIPANVSKTFLSKVLAQEALSLTDNPSVLQVSKISKDKNKKKTTDALNRRYKTPRAESVLSIPTGSNEDAKKGVLGDPIVMRLPPESVTVIHTPSDPNDHQGYLVLLDATGNPVSILDQPEDPNSNQQHNIFNQIYNAHGLSSAQQINPNQQMMEHVYSKIVGEHIRKRLGKAGYGQSDMGNLHSIYRCMFSRFLQQKQTRVLFLPKDLVTYMSFELDPQGYGVSRLERIKFSLSMKMAVQVSRVMAAIKAAMDKRKIDMRFTENMLEQPEAIFQNVIREYVNKNSLSFNIDPNVIQNQIIDKSISIKASGIPGMEDFDITNEPDSRSGTIDFDPSMLEYLDKQITNGLRIPASAMNSLSEDEYARSVATTNLFFSMDVSIDQDITIKHISDFLRKYARYSEPFQNKMIELIPELGKRKKKTGNSSTDESIIDDKDNKEGPNLPDGYDLDKLINSMLISLPAPNVAPSKAQFESLEAMVTAITNMMNALFPDDLIGKDDSLRPVVAMLRSKFTSTNIRTYLEGSGLTGFNIPDTKFTAEYKEIIEFDNSLRNIAAMLTDKAKIDAPAEEAVAPAGY